MIQLEAPADNARVVHLEKVAKANCRNAYPRAKQGLVDLELATSVMTLGGLMNFMEHHVVCLPERVRRLLSHYGAVGGMSAGTNWRDQTTDSTNLIYVTVWEQWKREEQQDQFHTCRSITNLNTAGNLVELLMGVGFIHCHHPKEKPLDALQVTQQHHDQARGFVSRCGSTIAQWVPIVERAIKGMESVWKACPWIQTTNWAYDRQLMQCHVEALRLGFMSGKPFFHRGVFPVISFHTYPDNIRVEPEDELQPQFLSVRVLSVMD